MTEPHQRGRTSVDVADIDTMTVKELLLYMMDKHVSSLVIPFGTEIFAHVALVFDHVESSKLSEHLKKVTYVAIQKQNAKYTSG